MKVPTHPGGRRVPATEVCLVLQLAKPFNGRQWAAHFGVSLRTLRTWTKHGLLLDLWAGPTAQQWQALKAEAVSNVWQAMSTLGGK